MYRKATVLSGPGDHVLLEANPATASRVLGELWVGSAPPIGARTARIFDCLILAAAEYQPDPGCFGGMDVHGLSLYDDGEPMSTAEMAASVRAAGKVVAWLSRGKRVLVTCHMGLNRSGLVAALAMCCGPGRVSVEDSIAAMRKARGPRALSNRQFVAFLKAYCGRGVRPEPSSPKPSR